jgi:amidohydrolase
MFEDEISQFQNEMTEIFRDLHRHPEIGFDEHRTAGIVAKHLRESGLDVTEGVALTGVVGLLDSGVPGKTLMLRADMDCLEITELAQNGYESLNPGKMHACGHDGHVSMLLMAAKILSRHKNSFKGKIKFVFQPAEEQTPKSMMEKIHAAGYTGHGGAGFMVREGILDGVDACLILHVQPSLPTGTVSISRRNACASSDVFNIRIRGKGGHGAQPHNAVDPVPAMAELISAVHILPTREISALETCVVSIGSAQTPGSVWNAVAESAYISGGFRTFNTAVREHLARRIRELSETIAAGNRCTLDYVHEPGYMPCINDEKMAASVAENLGKVMGDANVVLTDVPAMTSEDCGAYLEKVPGVFFWLGAGQGAASPALHNPHFMLDSEALALGVRVHIANALFLLNE